MVQVMDMEEVPPSSTDRNKWKKRLSKKDSLYYRPSEVENKMLETIVLKVLIH
jgi:hypothetical protein